MTSNAPSAPCLMVQGTGSGAGKSVLTAALCRLFVRTGCRVAPFKAQNMALNAAVTIDGGEIGRAQAAQAEAARVEPTTDMNPILLKPETAGRSQLVVHGRARGSVSFAEYLGMRDDLVTLVAESLTRLRRAFDLVLIEGAGSPAEINLSEHEIVNMTVARLAGARVVIVGDIDRGGVFAALVGTMALLAPDDRARVGGFVINKFRGDVSLLAPALEMLAARTGVPVLGVVPHIDELRVPPEDSLDLDEPSPPGDRDALEIAVVRLPFIANFDDFDALAREPGVRVRFIRRPRELRTADLIVLPGSKSTIADLRWLRARGFADAIVAAAAAGRPVLGICGGYQMLGTSIRDPDRVESEIEDQAGLGLLPLRTTFGPVKTTAHVQARVQRARGPFAGAAGTDFTAYEIHAGQSDLHTGAAASMREDRPFAIVARGGRPASGFDGIVSERLDVTGTYLHGLFASGSIRRALLSYLAERRGVAPDERWGTREQVDPYDHVADVVAVAVDVEAIARLAGVSYPPAGAPVSASVG